MCEALWQDSHFYRATVQEVQGTYGAPDLRFIVSYVDFPGHSGTVPISGIRPLSNAAPFQPPPPAPHQGHGGLTPRPSNIHAVPMQF